MGIEYIMALITLAAVVASFFSARAARDGVQTARDQIAASVEIAEKQIASSIEIAEKQIKAQLVSANRQKWIEELRSHLADYASEVARVIDSLIVGTYSNERAVKMTHLQNIVLLHLDGESEPHRKLWSAVLQITEYLNGLVGNCPTPEDIDSVNKVLDELEARKELVLNLAHDCLRRELALVRRGE